jgi:hypothetical protein
VLAAVRQNGHALKWVEGTLNEDKDVVLAAAKQTWRALMWTNLRKVNDDAKNAAKAQWPEGEDFGELVCRFVRPSGEVLEDADAWDKTTHELQQLVKINDIVQETSLVTFVDEDADRPLGFSVVPYPKELCTILAAHEPKCRRMPRLTLVVLNSQC